MAYFRLLLGPKEGSGERVGHFSSSVKESLGVWRVLKGMWWQKNCALLESVEGELANVYMRFRNNVLG